MQYHIGEQVEFTPYGSEDSIKAVGVIKSIWTAPSGNSYMDVELAPTYIVRYVHADRLAKRLPVACTPGDTHFTNTSGACQCGAS